MKLEMLGKLAFRNAKRSLKDYLIYLITITISFSLIFSFNLVASSDAVIQLSSGMDSFQMIISFVNIVIIFVVCFLINYTTKFMFEKRSKEFGTYMLLGIKKKEIAKMFVLENLILGLVALLLSIPIGFVISQFISLIIVTMLDIPKVVFLSLNLVSVQLLAVYFIAMYLLVLLNMLWKIKKMTVHSFLYLDKQNEEKMFRNSRKRNIIFGISLIIGIASIWLWYSRFQMEFISKNETLTYLMLSMIGLIISIYGISAKVSDMVFSFIIRSKKIKYQKDNLFLIRTFVSKARTMSFTFGTLSMLILLSIFSLNISNLSNGLYKSSLDQEAPYDVSIYDDQEAFKEYIKVIEEDYTVEKTLAYDIYKEQKKQIQKLYDEFTDYDSVMKLSDYNQLLTMRNMDTISLQEDEYIIVTSSQSKYLVEGNESIKQIQLSSGDFLQLKGVTTETIWYTLNSRSDFVIVVPDPYVKNLELAESHLIVDTKEETTASLETKIEERMSYRLCKTGSDGEIDCQYYRVRVRGSAIEENNTMIAMMSSIFLYISFIFIAVVGTILSIQALSDSTKYKYRYLTLRRLGVNDKTLYKTIRKQLFILFGMPAVYPILVNFSLIDSINNVYHIFLENQYSYLFYFAGGLAIFLLIYTVYWLTTYIGFKRNINEES